MNAHHASAYETIVSKVPILTIIQIYGVSMKNAFILGLALMGCVFINVAEAAEKGCGCKKRKHNCESQCSYLANNGSNFDQLEACSRGKGHGHGHRR
jgi:hypothetical protein